jgi:adenylate cyclase
VTFADRSLWRLLLVGGLVGLATVGAAALDPLGFFEGAELKGLNAHFRLRGPVRPISPIVIVTIDEDSFDELNQTWPWPRALHAQLLDIVSRARPAAIGLDLVFAEPSSRGAADDQALALAVARAGNVVLGAALTTVTEARFVKEDLNPPIRPIRDGARAFGYVNFEADSDAFVRRVTLAHPFQGQDLVGFDLGLYRLAGERIPVPRSLMLERETFINFRGGPRTFPNVPYHQVLAGQVSPDVFAGNIVLIGATSPVLHDVFPTPFAPRGDMSGVEIHANALETMLQGIPIRRAPPAVAAILAVLGGALAVWIASTVRPFVALVLVGGAVVGYLAGTHAAFLSGWWMAALPAPLALGTAYGGTVLRNFVRERREKRRLSRFFSPAVVQTIIRQKDDGKLSAARRRMTVLFSDIRGFTTMSERMAPEDVVAMLREYLTAMTEVVFKHGGTVDKYIGDEIMALYNVPLEVADHADRAVRTALEFQERLRPLAERFSARYGGTLQCGVGIHTGDAVVGTIGSEQRLEYTAIGDTINLGARLESATKEFGVSIIISEATYVDLKSQFATRYLGEVHVKGKEIPVKIHAVLTPAAGEATRDSRDVQA